MIKVDAKLRITVESKNGLTVPSEVYFTQPYNLTNFFRLPSGGIEYIVMNSSAGIMANDRYNVNLEVKGDSRLSLLSQSYEKIHKMDDGYASRETNITIGDNASLKYFPLPTIPFADSAFENITNIKLADASSKLIYADFISSGRYHNNERFKYKCFKSRLNVFIGEKLIFRENNRFLPERENPDSIRLFENYDCMANVLTYGFDICVDELPSSDGIEMAITELPYCGILLRAFGKESDNLHKFVTEAIKYFK